MRRGKKTHGGTSAGPDGAGAPHPTLATAHQSGLAGNTALAEPAAKATAILEPSSAGRLEIQAKAKFYSSYGDPVKETRSSAPIAERWSRPAERSPSRLRALPETPRCLSAARPPAGCAAGRRRISQGGAGSDRSSGHGCEVAR